MYNISELQKAVSDYMASLDLNGQPDGLYSPIRYSLEGGGKRIRPMLTVTSCNIFSDNALESMPAAAAVEVFHNFTLLHDDIMDNAAVRRGKPSVVRKWGENVAILSGDAMVIYAYKLLQMTPAVHLPAILGCFNHMAITVCEGQQLDMDYEMLEEVSIAEYMKMTDKKTSALLVGATLIGAITGGADKTSCHNLMTFASELGLAFQLQDDLLDTYGNEDELGKRIGGDIVESKKTYLTVVALQKADKAMRRHFLGLLHNKNIIDELKINQVLEIYEALNIKENTEQEIGLHFNRAVESLAAVEAPDERKEPILELAKSLMNRNK